MQANQIIEQAEVILRTMLQLNIIERDNTGGYLTVLQLDFPSFVERLTLGSIISTVNCTITDEEFTAYRAYSREKAERLMNHSRQKHVSSHQSRDPRNSQWGGAIRVIVHQGESLRTQHYILSFSGLPELADEALMLGVAVSLSKMTHEEALEIATISGNKFYPALADKVNLSA